MHAFLIYIFGGHLIQRIYEILTNIRVRASTRWKRRIIKWLEYLPDKRCDWLRIIGKWSIFSLVPILYTVYPFNGIDKCKLRKFIALLEMVQCDDCIHKWP